MLLSWSDCMLHIFATQCNIRIRFVEIAILSIDKERCDHEAKRESQNDG